MSNTFIKNIDKNLQSSLTLDKASLNCPYVILSVELPPILQTRFAELGFVRGAVVVVTKRAPLGDPLEVKIMGYSLCARANELKYVTVARADDD